MPGIFFLVEAGGWEANRICIAAFRKIWMCTEVHACIVYACIYVCMQVSVCECVCIRSGTHAHVCPSVCECMHECACVQTHASVCVCLSLFTCKFTAAESMCMKWEGVPWASISPAAFPGLDQLYPAVIKFISGQYVHHSPFLFLWSWLQSWPSAPLHSEMLPTNITIFLVKGTVRSVYSHLLSLSSLTARITLQSSAFSLHSPKASFAWVVNTVLVYSDQVHTSLPPLCIMNASCTNLVAIIPCCQSHTGIGSISLLCHGKKFTLLLLSFLGLSWTAVLTLCELLGLSRALHLAPNF